jgi:hypothetical protein
LIWIERDADSAIKNLVRLFECGSEIDKRVAVHVADVKWESLGRATSEFCKPCLFDENLIHETYQLLQHRYGQFSDSEKDAVRVEVGLGPDLPPLERDDKDLRREWRWRQRWLSAIISFDQPGARRRAEVLDAALGAVSDHPDFLSYMESWYGPGPSKFSKAQLIQALSDGSLIGTLNGFIQTSEWDGESTAALATELTDAVKEQPSEFLEVKNSFLSAKRPYQYAYLNAFKQLWDLNDGGSRRRRVSL